VRLEKSKRAAPSPKNHPNCQNITQKRQGGSQNHLQNNQNQLQNDQYCLQNTQNQLRNN